jgi:hypothetical protein
LRAPEKFAGLLASKKIPRSISAIVRILKRISQQNTAKQGRLVTERKNNCGDAAFKAQGEEPQPSAGPEQVNDLAKKSFRTVGCNHAGFTCLTPTRALQLNQRVHQALITECDHTASLRFPRQFMQRGCRG